LTTGSCCKA